MKRMLSLATALLAALTLAQAAAHAADLADVDEIVRRANLAAYYAGSDGRSEARMLIEDAQGRKQLRQFTILRKDESDGGDQHFMVFFSRPSDVRGTVFLVDKHVATDDDRWLYLPGLDLVKRISAGDKRTSFVGSHFFYEDVSGRNPSLDEHVLVETTGEHYVLESRPKDPSLVEFASYRAWIDKTTFMPVKIEYADAAGRVYRRVESVQVEEVQGFPTTTRSKVSDLDSGGSTLMEFRFIEYDVGLPGDIFSERYMRTPPVEWLKRDGD